MSTSKGSSTRRSIESVADPLHLMSGKGKPFKDTTMGRWFQKPSTKFPESKTDNSAAQLAEAAKQSAMATAKEKERLRLKASAGRRSLISTSGRGVLEPATVKQKKLLGE